MRIVDVRERSVAISRYRDATIPSGGLTTSIVAVVTDVMRAGRPMVGWGFASVGRFAQGGLIRERFAPRLVAAADLATAAGDGLDPLQAWRAMMASEKPGGHGERCVAVGTLAFWPHGGHLFTLHVAGALGLGGAEMNPLAFGPFGGLVDGTARVKGRVAPPEVPGIGFEEKAELARLFRTLLDD
jgi:L-alanine-DL-glutamate epimerase-like enolase superfamily enzyme